MRECAGCKADCGRLRALHPRLPVLGDALAQRAACAPPTMQSPVQLDHAPAWHVIEGAPREPAGQVALHMPPLGVSLPQSVTPPPGAAGMSFAGHAAR